MDCAAELEAIANRIRKPDTGSVKRVSRPANGIIAAGRITRADLRKERPILGKFKISPLLSNGFDSNKKLFSRSLNVLQLFFWVKLDSSKRSVANAPNADERQ